MIYIYNSYCDRFGSYIGLDADIPAQPFMPHYLHGVFIANCAKIGSNVTIYHHVTIGANQLKGSKNFGSPIIGDNVLIGAGAKIIGKISIGKNSRIGAGCIVTKDIPENSIVVMPQPTIRQSCEPLVNDFVKYNPKIK